MTVNSIELSGPLGYDRQYEAVLLIALHRWERLKRLTVEPGGGEDAELVVDGDTFELQSKSTTQDVSADALGEWLLHYPSLQHSGSLLERLVADDHRHAVFLCGGRACDAVRNLLRPAKDALDTTPTPITLDLGRAIQSGLYSRVAVLQTATKDTVDQLRGVSAQSYLNKLKLNEVRAALKRVVIVERVADAEISERLDRALHTICLVPPSGARACALALVAEQKLARASRSDLLPMAKVLLLSWSTKAVLPAGLVHVPRPDEQALLYALTKSHILLLAGETGCGKTRTAKRVVEEQRRVGLVCFESSSPDEAARHLRDTANEDRLVLLEDPLGAIEPAPDARSRLHALRELVRAVGPHRRLVVTSRTSVLTRAMGAKDLANCALEGFPWHDLTVTDPILVVEIWRAHASDRILPAEQSNRVERILTQTDRAQPQPFGLSELARRPASELKDATDEGIVRLARAEVQELAIWLGEQSKPIRESAFALALGADGLVRMPREALSWLLDADGGSPGALPADAGSCATLGVTLSPAVFPRWAGVPLDHWEQALERLVDQRWLEESSDGIRFVHPSYAQAALLTPAPGTEPARARRASLISRSPASLHPAGAEVAARACATLLEVGDTSTLVIAARSGLIAALRSIFPRVQDAAVMALTTLPHLAEEVFDPLLSAVRASENVGDHLVWLPTDGLPAWLAGEPWLDPREQRSWGEYELRHAPEGEARRVLALMEADLTWLPTALQARPLAVLAANGDVPTEPALLMRLLAIPERFIRRDVARALLSWAPILEHSYLDRLIADHPAVVAGAVHGLLDGVGTRPLAATEAAATRIAPVLRHPAYAIACFGLLGDIEETLGFSAVNADDANTAARAQVWGLLAPAFFEGLPSDAAWANQGRLWGTATWAASHLAPSRILVIADAWATWIRRALPSGWVDSYGLAAAEFLFTGTAPTDRGDRLASLLAPDQPRLAMAALTDALARWATLGEAERLAVTAMVTQGGEHSVQHRLAVLNASAAPPELLARVFGVVDLRARPASECVQLLPADVLAQGVGLHFGIGAHPNPDVASKGGMEWWQECVESILADRVHPVFAIAVDAVLATARAAGRWQGGIDAWLKAVQEADAAGRVFLQQRLLIWSVRVGSCRLAQFWEAWWSAASTEEHSDAQVAILEVIEAVMPH